MQPDIAQTLAERGTRYGGFPGHAKITQSIKTAMVQTRNWSLLADDQKEALEMVAHKIGRILNGDPNYHDSWHDIVGYTKLVADRIQMDEIHASPNINPPGTPKPIGVASTQPTKSGFISDPQYIGAASCG